MNNSKLNKAKKLISNKFSIPMSLLDDSACFMERQDGKLLALVSFFNYDLNDNCLYLYDCDTLNQFYTKPIMQIKFQDKKYNEFYLRRLEYCDYSNKEYLNKGYASNFMKLLEEFALKNNYKLITGELIPLHGANPQHVEDFYLKNDFKTYIGDNNQKCIFKKINIKKNDFADNEEKLM